VGSQNRRRTLKHNYPKNRKPNDNSTTQILLKKYSEKELYNFWIKYNGMFKTSDYLSKEMGFWVTPYVIRYLSNKFNWIRVITDKELPIYKGILNKRVLPEYYKHINFQ
jgi:hypothetical protein